MPTKPADAVVLKQTLQSAAQHEVWEARYRTARSEDFYEQVFDWLSAKAGITPGEQVLDIGCGIGAHAVRLARRGFRVVAADFSSDRVAAARASVQASGTASLVRVQEEDLRAGLSFDSNSFSGVLCWGVLMHIHDNEQAMAELIRVTRPGGAIIVAESNFFSLDGVASFVAAVVRRLSGSKQRKRMEWTNYGMEYLTSTPSGDLVVRHSRIPGLVRFFESRGCYLRHRVSGQFSESFTKMGSTPFAGAVHTFNSAWFSALKWPRASCGNILVFQRRQQ